MSIHAPVVVCIGTKAQYIKMAPLLLSLDRHRVGYRLVLTGQHSETFDTLEKAFGTRSADDNIVPAFEAATHASFLRWAWRFWRGALARARRDEIGAARIMLVHGDTASTLFATLLARLLGVAVAHVEAGLRSPRLLDPFPEEVIRRVVSRLTQLHLAPDAAACSNLSGVGGEVVDTGGNTLRDALRLSMRGVPEVSPNTSPYAVVSLHRNENLSRRENFELLMQEVQVAATRIPIRFVLHPATREKLRATGWMGRLAGSPQIELLERSDHADFLRLLVGARFLMTDGGSNQEEAAMLGLPTLLLRRATERPDGLGDCVMLSLLDRNTIRAFVARHAQGDWEPRLVDAHSPSDRIVSALQRWLANTSVPSA